MNSLPEDTGSPSVNGVPLLDLKAQYANIRSDVEAAIRDVCDSQYFVMGPKVVELEERIAAYSSSEFGIGVSSGTDALLVALMALDIGPGDEVLTTPFSFFATVGVISRLGARPVFCDIEPDTYNLDPQEVRRFIERQCDVRDGVLIDRKTNGSVKAMLPVHLFGQTANTEALQQLADEFHLHLVEDAAQAIGAEDQLGRRAGSIGKIGCFSFFPSKNLGAFGDGGMCVTSDPDLAEKLRVLRLHGGKPKYYHSIVGGNFRLDAIQAAVLLVKLGHLDSWTEERQSNANLYDKLLADVPGITLPKRSPGGRHIFNQYTLRVKDRNALREKLTSRNIGTEIYYPVPLHLQKCFSGLGYATGDFPEAENAAESVLSIPIYPELEPAQVEYVASVIRSHAG